MQQYPTEFHSRRHGPAGLTTYQSYKPWLRDEFTFRCVYCLERERWYPSRDHGFGVDHIKPKGKPEYAHLECDYENLVYACNRCNSAKGVEEFPDPTEVALGKHLAIDESGEIIGLTEAGNDMIVVLGLDQPTLTNTRSTYIGIAKLHEAFPHDSDVRKLFVNAFGYPEDLPDLHSLKPKHNSRPEGRDASHFVQRSMNKLNLVYIT